MVDLGVISPKLRALAGLIFRYHETDLPYYSPDFFSTIRKAKEETPLNVINMTISQWTRLLEEDN